MMDAGILVMGEEGEKWPEPYGFVNDVCQVREFIVPLCILERNFSEQQHKLAFSDQL